MSAIPFFFIGVRVSVCLCVCASLSLSLSLSIPFFFIGVQVKIGKAGVAVANVHMVKILAEVAHFHPKYSVVVAAYRHRDIPTDRHTDTQPATEIRQVIIQNTRSLRLYTLTHRHR